MDKMRFALAAWAVVLFGTLPNHAVAMPAASGAALMASTGPAGLVQPAHWRRTPQRHYWGWGPPPAWGWHGAWHGASSFDCDCCLPRLGWWHAGGWHYW